MEILESIHKNFTGTTVYLFIIKYLQIFFTNLELNLWNIIDLNVILTLSSRFFTKF